MILVDSSVWIDHLRATDRALAALLDRAQVLAHPFVVGELSLGILGQRRAILDALQGLPQAIVAKDSEALAFIDRHALHGRGIGYIDAHLLTSARLTADAALWTRDKRLQAVAAEFGIAA